MRALLARSLLAESELLPLVEEVHSRIPQVYYFGTPIPVLLEATTRLAVVSVGYPYPSTDNASPLVVPVVAIVAYPNQG